MFQTFTLDKSLLGPMSPWTKVFLDKCALDKVVLGQLSLGQMYQHRSQESCCNVAKKRHVTMPAVPGHPEATTKQFVPRGCFCYLQPKVKMAHRKMFISLKVTKQRY